MAEAKAKVNTVSFAQLIMADAHTAEFVTQTSMKLSDAALLK